MGRTAAAGEPEGRAGEGGGGLLHFVIRKHRKLSILLWLRNERFLSWRKESDKENTRKTLRTIASPPFLSVLVGAPVSQFFAELVERRSAI